LNVIQIPFKTKYVAVQVFKNFDARGTFRLEAGDGSLKLKDPNTKILYTPTPKKVDDGLVCDPNKKPIPMCLN
jgi:hypothetical protein